MCIPMRISQVKMKPQGVKWQVRALTLILFSIPIPIPISIPILTPTPTHTLTLTPLIPLIPTLTF